MLAAADTTPPSTPTQLHVASVTSTSMSLQWRASPDNKNATGLTPAPYNAGGLLPRTSYQFAVSSTDAFGSSGLSGLVDATTAAGGGTSSGFPAHLFAPYIDMLEYPTPSLSGLATSTGQEYF